jgi:hypothetical protein
MLTHKRAFDDAAFGEPLLKRGVVELEFTIMRSAGNDGACMYLGVADAASEGRSGGGWGVSLCYGHLIHFPRSAEWEGETLCRYPELQLGKGVRTMVGTEQSGYKIDRSRSHEGKRVLPGTVVGVRVDMTERSLSFCVDGGDWLPATGAALPGAVRPWVKMRFKGDAVSLSARRVGGRASVPPTPLLPPIAQERSSPSTQQRGGGALAPQAARKSALGAGVARASMLEARSSSCDASPVSRRGPSSDAGSGREPASCCSALLGAIRDEEEALELSTAAGSTVDGSVASADDDTSCGMLSPGLTQLKMGLGGGANRQLNPAFDPDGGEGGGGCIGQPAWREHAGSSTWRPPADGTSPVSRRLPQLVGGESRLKPSASMPARIAATIPEEAAPVTVLPSAHAWGAGPESPSCSIMVQLPTLAGKRGHGAAAVYADTTAEVAAAPSPSPKLFAATALSKSVSAPGLIKSMLTAPLAFSSTVPRAPVRLTPVVRGEPTNERKKEQRQRRLDPGLRLREERRRLAKLARQLDQQVLSEVQWEQRQRRPHWERPPPV